MIMCEHKKSSEGRGKGVERIARGEGGGGGVVATVMGVWVGGLEARGRGAGADAAVKIYWREPGGRRGGEGLGRHIAAKIESEWAVVGEPLEGRRGDKGRERALAVSTVGTSIEKKGVFWS